MKKVRLIIAVVTIALMVMGVGYAAWGQALPVTVNGDLYTFHPVLFDIRYPDEPGNIGNNTSSIAADRLSGTITTPKLFPGAGQTYFIYVENKSTDMSAKLTGVDISAMSGERASIVQVSYGLGQWGNIGLAGANVVGHGNQHFNESYILAPGEKQILRVRVFIPAEETNKAFGNDNTFTFTITPTFAQVNPY